MTYTPRTTEYAARQTIDGLTDEILGLVNPANDGMLAAWQMALTKAQEMAVALDHACRAIAARPMITGNDALRAVADEPPFSDEPFHEQIRQTIEARKADQFKVGDEVVMLETYTSSISGTTYCSKGDKGTITRKSGGGWWVDFIGHGNPVVCGGGEWSIAEHQMARRAIPVETPQEAEALDEIEARQIDAAHPEVFNMADFAARSLGLGKGA